MRLQKIYTWNYYYLSWDWKINSFNKKRKLIFFFYSKLISRITKNKKYQLTKTVEGEEEVAVYSCCFSLN
jgi:hypothetical protein